MADTQEYNGKKVTISQNPLNSLWYIQEVKSPEETQNTTHVIGLARDNGYQGYGYKTKDDAQYAIDNQAPPLPEPTMPADKALANEDKNPNKKQQSAAGEGNTNDGKNNGSAPA